MRKINEKENPEDVNMLIDANFLFKKDSPTTVIDLSNKKIYRTAILNDFIELK